MMKTPQTRRQLKRDAMPPANRSFGRSLLSPLFLICVVLVLGGAVGLRPLMRELASRYLKESIALRSPLEEFNVARLDSFQPALVTLAPPSSIKDVETDDVLWLNLESPATRNKNLHPGLFVTYYSDPRDKVPHTPEVCYRQGGCTIESITTTTFEAAGLGPDHPPVEVRIVDMKTRERRRVVLYLFWASGEPCWDREQVRWIIGRPGDRYVYFSKIEATTPYMLKSEKPQAIEMCRRLLKEALPVLVNEHFPATADLKGA